MIPYRSGSIIRQIRPELDNDRLSPLFLAVVEATEEAIYNSLFMAEEMTGYEGHHMEALPIDRTLEILDRHDARQAQSNFIILGGMSGIIAIISPYTYAFGCPLCGFHLRTICL